MRNKKNYPSIIIEYSSYSELWLYHCLYLSVRGDNPRALVSGLSPIQADKPSYSHPHQCLAQYEILPAEISDF